MSGFLENDYLASWKDFPRESLKGPGDSLEVGPRMGQEWVTAPSLAADDQATSPGSSLGAGAGKFLHYNHPWQLMAAHPTSLPQTLVAGLSALPLRHRVLSPGLFAKNFLRLLRWPIPKTLCVFSKVPLWPEMLM